MSLLQDRQLKTESATTKQLVFQVLTVKK